MGRLKLWCFRRRLHRYYVSKQQHIYNSPFYYIDYVLAQTCAFMYKIRMEEDRQAAWESYLRLCQLSACKFYSDMLHTVGLEVPYEEGCIARMAEKLEELRKKM